jgi:glycosyltransferase involved in cell wall biosynthesis
MIPRAVHDTLQVPAAAEADTRIGNKISVVLLTYNHADAIESTLRSILDQTIAGYEVIVSDDCSTDGTWEKILQIAEKESRIKPLRTPRNMSMPGNANFAIGQSNRPYVALLHHDDLYRRDLLEKWVGVLERHPSVGFVFNRYDSNIPERHDGPVFAHECLDGDWFLRKFLFGGWGCPVRGTAMIRRSVWKRVGGMREQFNLIADVDLWMRLARVSQVGYVRDPVIYVRELRPEYYPDIYTLKRFHWRRIVLLYQIHASNRLTYLPLRTLWGRSQWLMFRVRLSCETAKWLLYGLVRKKRRREILPYSAESITEYDLWPLRVLRAMVQFLFHTVDHTDVEAVR